MREIKFRAWDIRNEVMWLRKPKQLTSEFFQLIEQDEQGGEQFVLMQYTGLKDKNDVEIYEGDVVKGTMPDTERDRDFAIASIEWVEDGFAVIDPRSFYLGDVSSPVMNHCIEVIGNIYENPELLEPEAHTDNLSTETGEK